MSQGRIEALVANLGTPLAEDLGYELIDVEYRKEGPDWILRCSIDCETGVGINECQRFSEALEKLLDQEDPIPGHYLLEISSPGAERPLKKDRDFERFSGSRAEIKLFQPLNGQKIFHGQLLGIKKNETDQSIQVILNSDNRIVEIPRQTIAKARLVQESINPSQSGKGGKKGK